MQAPDLVYICDWLPPDFGAVGQYSLMFATELAEQGQHVALVGLVQLRGAAGNARASDAGA